MKNPLLYLPIMAVVILSCGGCKPNDDPVARHTGAVTIVNRPVARDAEHPMQADQVLARDEKAEARPRAKALERMKLNCDDLVKLRALIDVGRPLQDYSPIEKIG